LLLIFLRYIRFYYAVSPAVQASVILVSCSWQSGSGKIYLNRHKPAQFANAWYLVLQTGETLHWSDGYSRLGQSIQAGKLTLMGSYQGRKLASFAVKFVLLAQGVSELAFCFQANATTWRRPAHRLELSCLR
jgi:hypothetical protein